MIIITEASWKLVGNIIHEGWKLLSKDTTIAPELYRALAKFQTLEHDIFDYDAKKVIDIAIEYSKQGNFFYAYQQEEFNKHAKALLENETEHNPDLARGEKNHEMS